MRPVLGLERVEDEPQRGRDQERRAQGLDHPERDQQFAEGAAAQSAEAPVNSSTPKTKVRRRPKQVAILPPATRNAANTTL